MSARKDLTGHRFGRLVAINPTGKSVGGSAVWHCKCDCGNYKDVAAKYLTTGRTKSCGCRKIRPIESLRGGDLTGKRFGKLVAIEPTGEIKHGLRVWRCQCDCGNVVDVISRPLIDGNTKSCGCIRSSREKRDESIDQTAPSNYLAGQRFGKLLAVEPVGKTNSGDTVWRCQCECGNYKDVTQFCLVYGRTKTCGKCNKNDLTGKRFGKLTVVSQSGKDRYGAILWCCKCDCGNYKDATTTYLTKSTCPNCGCERSSRDGEITCKGVSYLKSIDKYQSRISVDKQHYNLGRYNDLESATKARKDAEDHLQAGDFSEWFKVRRS